MIPRWLYLFTQAVLAYAAVFVTIVLVTWLGGCRDPEIPRASLYGAKLAVCVEKAKTRNEADACRRAVDCHFGQGPCPDGGADAGP